MSKELREQFEKETEKNTFIWNNGAAIGYTTDYTRWLEYKLREAKEKLNTSEIGYNNLKIISKKQADIIQAVKDSLFTDKEIDDLVEDTETSKLQLGVRYQRDRTLKALNQKT